MIELPHTDKIGECRAVQSVALDHSNRVDIGRTNVLLDERNLAEILALAEASHFLLIPIWQVFCDSHVARTNDEEQIARRALI